MINARSESAAEKPMFRKSLVEQRCLVLASGYYEWRRTQSGGKSKEKYALYRADQPIYMAGLWRMEQGEELPVFVILTREAGPSISDIQDRMLVILPDEICREWLSTSADTENLMDRAYREMAFQAV